MSIEKNYTLSEEAYRKKLEYIAEYNKKMARLTIQLPPEDKERIKGIATKKGMSLKELILTAIYEYVGR